MNLFLLNTLLAIGWCAVVGSFGLLNLVIGFALGWIAMFLLRSLYWEDVGGGTSYFRRFWRVIAFIGYFIKELFVSSLQVVWDVLTPPQLSTPGVVAMELEAKTDMEIMMVANLISLTPGTLSLEVSEDRRLLYVHGMFVDAADLHASLAPLKEMERRLLELVR